MPVCKFLLYIQATCKWNYVESEGGYQKDFMEAIGLEDYEEKMVTRVDKIGTYLGKISPNLQENLILNRCNCIQVE